MSFSVLLLVKKKLINLSVFVCFRVLEMGSNTDARGSNTLSCLHLYEPCVRTVLYDDNTCSIMYLLLHNTQLLPTVVYNLFEFTGVGT